MFYSLYFVSLGRVPIGIPCKLTEYSDMSKEKEEKLAEISARITKVIAYLGETANSFATKLGYQRAQTIYDIQKKKSAPSYDFFQRFTIAGYSAIINFDWLLTGEGNMLRSEEPSHSLPVPEKKRHLIPLFDVTTIDGRQYDADMAAVSTPSEMIDTGDWFQDATAAMRVQGDSMSPEYKSGSIVALRQINDQRIIMYGEDYVVETDEIRVIKRLQRADDPAYLMACSVNQDQWESGPMKGHLIHEPFEIPRSSIRRLFLVLGEVRRNHSCNIIDVVK